MVNRPLYSQNAVVLDLQTTGSSGNDHIIEIGYNVAGHSYEQSDICSHLVELPEGHGISKRVRQLTGISDEMFESEEVYSLDDLKSLPFLVNRSPLIIHYAQFERPFLKLLMDGREPLIICTHKLAQRLFPALPSKSLRSVSGHLGYPIGELKRSAHHVGASRFIWEKMIPLLHERGLTTLEEVYQWIQRSKPPKVSKAFSISSQFRLSLPKSPGIYQMLDSEKSVLYVGKAKNLRARISSYFTGKKSKGARLNEMLSQVKDIKVTEALSPCHAAILEVDHIKTQNPPYNRALRKSDHIFPCFSTSHFYPTSELSDIRFGPFRSQTFFEHFCDLKSFISQKGMVEIQHQFFDEVDSEIITAGFDLFRAQFVTKNGMKNWRRIVLELWKESLENIRTKRINKDIEDDVEIVTESEEEWVWTPSTILSHCRRTMAGFGHRLLKGRWMRRLLNSRILISYEDGCIEYIHIINGSVSFSSCEKDIVIQEVSSSDFSSLFDLATFDRMNVLLSELKRIVQENVEIELKYHSGPSLDKRAIVKYLFPELFVAEA